MVSLTLFFLLLAIRRVIPTTLFFFPSPIYEVTQNWQGEENREPNSQKPDERFPKTYFHVILPF
jgi:hypothetical protein